MDLRDKRRSVGKRRYGNDPDRHQFHHAGKHRHLTKKDIRRLTGKNKLYSIYWPPGYTPTLADQIVALKRASDAARAQIAAINRERALAKGNTGTIVMGNTPKNLAPRWMNNNNISTR